MLVNQRDLGCPCPIFIRGIAMEGSIGPVAGSSQHSIYFKMPGIKIVLTNDTKRILNCI